MPTVDDPNASFPCDIILEGDSPGKATSDVANEDTATGQKSTNELAAAPPQSVASASSSAPSHVLRAFEETRHFAGGLIHHPSESNKHFSVLRHSHGLVYFQGQKTSIAISIFADAPLPPDRSLWLQCKGYSGKTGMRLKTLLGADGSWLNVTPGKQIPVDQLKPSDERAWQRDIAHFLKRSDPHIRNTHHLRETAIVHIPAGADDGYFRLVLCTGEHKKVLCGSPTFRLLSTSTKPGMVRGAGLASLPFEVAAKIGATAANSFTGNVISSATAPYQQTIQQGQQVYQDGQNVYQVGQMAAPVVQKRIGTADKTSKTSLENEDAGLITKVKSGLVDARRDAQAYLQAAGVRVSNGVEEHALETSCGVFVVR